MLSIQIRETAKSAGVNISKQMADILSKYQSGIAGGLADQVNVALDITHQNYFVDTWRSRRKNATRGKAAYYPFPGANKADKKGRLKFQKGKIVSRTGDMADAVYPVTWSKRGSDSYFGKNKSPYFSVMISRSGHVCRARLTFTGDVARNMGIHINKSRIRIMDLGFKRSASLFKKMIKAGMHSKLNGTKGYRQ